ncbi:MAG: hypothetical protein D4S01_05125 [Dehalococcoidia bacterium]|nr:MAG: hypothetical protein D4S01_05125 [Dehalococcoidia bacterium]
MNWQDIKLGIPKSYRSTLGSRKQDRVKVELDMPTEVFSDFQKQIHIPHALEGRRKEDINPKQENPPIFDRKTAKPDGVIHILHNQNTQEDPHNPPK